MIYLASPYSHEDPFTREHRYIHAMQAVVVLMKKDRFVFSPIIYCHHMAHIAELANDAEFWLKFNRTMFDASERLVILRLDGWEESKGVKIEYDWAATKGIPIEYL